MRETDPKWFSCWYPELGESEENSVNYPADEAETPEVAAIRYAVQHATTEHGKPDAEVLVRVSWETWQRHTGVMDVAVAVEPASTEAPSLTGWRAVAVETRSVRDKMLRFPRSV